MKNTAMYPKAFAVDVINELYKQKHTIVFLTSRLDIYWDGNAKKYAKKWLKNISSNTMTWLLVK